MVEVSIRTNRGTKTGTIKVDVSDLKFSGAEFKAIQEKRKIEAGSINVSTGRGTGKRNLKDTPVPSEKPKPKRLSTNRGTKTTEL